MPDISIHTYQPTYYGPRGLVWEVHCVRLHSHVFVYSFVAGLRDHLQALYSQSSATNISLSSSSSSVTEMMTHVHYRSHNYIVEYTPLMLAYIVLCLYLYFSVRKYLLHWHIDIHADKQTGGETEKQLYC